MPDEWPSPDARVTCTYPAPPPTYGSVNEHRAETSGSDRPVNIWLNGIETPKPPTFHLARSRSACAAPSSLIDGSSLRSRSRRMIAVAIFLLYTGQGAMAATCGDGLQEEAVEDIDAVLVAYL